MKESLLYVLEVATFAIIFTAVVWGLLRLVRKIFGQLARESYGQETARANKLIELELLKHKLESPKQAPRDGEQK